MIPITRPHFGGGESEAIAKVISSGWISQGPVTAEFEARFAERVESRHAVATTNCTSALHLGLLVGGVGAGDEVVVPSLSFIATANAVRLCGATPVFADVEADTANLDPKAAEAAITERTRAVVPVHQLGNPVDSEAFAALGERTGVPIVEDAACAIGALFNGKPVGAGPSLACFSLHPRKVITTGEGGMLTVSDDAIADRLRRLRQHGMSVSDLERHGSNTVVLERYSEVGYNYRMTDIQAALGLCQMDVLDDCLAARRRLAAGYAQALGDVEGLEVPRERPGAEHTFQSYMIKVSPSLPVSRDELMQRMLDDGIATRRGVMAIHHEDPYRTPGDWDLPVTEEIAATGMLIPLYPDLEASDQDFVIERLRHHVGG